MTAASDQVIYGHLAALAREMAATLARLSRSPLIADDAAFAIGIVDRERRLVIQEQGEPSHLYAVREATRALMDYFAYDVAEGDVFIVADPFCGGTHAHLISVARPVFWKGQLEYVITCRVPLLDLAGELPGALQPFAFEVWQEAYRVTPLRLHRAGAAQRDVVRFLTVNSRAPLSLGAELDAVLAVGRQGERSLHTLMRHYGVPEMTSAATTSLTYSSKRLMGHLQSLLPRDGFARRSVRGPDGSAVTIEVRLGWRAPRVRLDFTGCSAAVSSSMNATAQLTRAAASIPLLAGVLDDVPLNDGVLEMFHAVLPDDSAVNAKPPAASSLSVPVTAHVIAAAVAAAARDAGASSEDVARVHGLAPSAILYSPVGTTDANTPLYLSPGFPVNVPGTGGPALHGRRRMASAEELEARHGLAIVSREMSEAGTMIVDVLNVGAAREATLVALGPLDDSGAPPRLELTGAARQNVAGGVAVAKVPSGAHLVFHYPAPRGAS